MTESERYRRGVEILRQVGGPEFDTPLKALEDVAPDLVRLAVEFGYGEIMSRPALDLPTRQLATVAALCAMGNAPSQLRYHIEGALNVGCPASHVTEVVLLSRGIVGSSLARDGLLAMNEVLRGRGLTPPIEVAAAEDPAGLEGRDDGVAEAERVRLDLGPVLAPRVRVRVFADRRREHAPGEHRRAEDERKERCDGARREPRSASSSSHRRSILIRFPKTAKSVYARGSWRSRRSEGPGCGRTRSSRR